jgi:hypothetical protein
MNWRQIESGWERLKDTAMEDWGRLTGRLGGKAVGSRCPAVGVIRERAEGMRRDSEHAVFGSRVVPDLAEGPALIGLGAGLMYVLDPVRGRRRRALVRDQLVHALNEIDGAIGVLARDLSNRSRGVWSGMKSLPRRLTGEEVPDDILVEQVRSELGRHVSHPRSIEVDVSSGRICLRGLILDHELDGLLAAVARVPGVTEVEHQLGIDTRPGDLVGVQEGRRRVGESTELSQSHWSPTARLLVGSAGTTLLAVGASRRGAAGVTLGALGTGLLLRAITNIPMRRWLGPEDSDTLHEAPMTSGVAREAGVPGGGRGRTDEVGLTGVYPGTGPDLAGSAAVRTPGSFVHCQRDAEGREVEGRSEPIDFNREFLLGGQTPPPSGESADAGSRREKPL